ncbi:MAG: APC family permease [Methanoregula sp.]|jgi:MFS family permease|nr:APC family permease [Methanoregula sp.]
MSSALPEPAGLKREIGFFGATALGIGAIIGSEIFVVTGIVAGIAGPTIIISVLIAGIIALFSALSVAEMSAYLPEEGGTYAYAQKLISPFAGFIAGWIWIFSNIFVGAAVSLGFGHYFVTLFPAIPVKGIGVIICLIFIIINYIGLKESTILNNTLVTLKVLILLFFVVFGLGYFSGGHVTPFAPAGISGVLSGAALIFFAYTGFARVTIMAEEVKDPEKTIPRSIYLALAIFHGPLYPRQRDCRGACRCTRSFAVGISFSCCNRCYWHSICSSSHIIMCDDRDSKCAPDNYQGDITNHVCDGMKGRPPGISQPDKPPVQHPALCNPDIRGIYDWSNSSC